MCITKRVTTLLFICVFLVGCSGGNGTTIGSEKGEDTTLTEEISELRKENMVLEDQVKELQERPSEQFMMDLRETMNISFKLLHAMEVNDYSYLESVSASGLVINKEDNQVYLESDQERSMNFLKGLHFNNLEYWSSAYLANDQEFQIGLAHFFDETHGTIYIDFIKEDGRWLFNGFITNA